MKKKKNKDNSDSDESDSDSVKSDSDNDLNNKKGNLIDKIKKLAELKGKNIDALKKAKAELKEACKCKNKIRTIPMDLSGFDAAEHLFKKVQNEPIELLINNAGFVLFGKFTETQWELEERMINLHILTLTHLTKYILKKMRMGFTKIFIMYLNKFNNVYLM